MYVNGMWRLSLTRIVCCPQPSFPAMRAVPFPHGEETYLLQERMTNVKTGNLISGIVSLSQPSPMGGGSRLVIYIQGSGVGVCKRTVFQSALGVATNIATPTPALPRCASLRGRGRSGAGFGDGCSACRQSIPSPAGRASVRSGGGMGRG